MENRAHALAAGLFTLLLGLAALLSIWWFAGKHETTKDYTVVTQQNVTGLSLQGQVRYRGIRVGKVQQIELDPVDVRNILIRISVNDAVPVTRGTTAKLGFQGVTGIAHILLEDAGSDPTPLRGGDGEAPRIAMRSSLMEQLSDAGGETLRQARDLLASANDMFDKQNRQRFDAIVANLETTTAHAGDAVGQFRQILSPENIRRLNALLAGAERASGEAAPVLVETRRLIVRLQEVSDRIETLVADPSPAGVAALAPRLNELSSEMSANSRQLGRVLQMLQDAPQSVLFGPPSPVPGPGEVGFAVPASTEGRP